MAHSDAKMAFDRAEFVKNQSESSRQDLQDLINLIIEFLEDKERATPAQIREVLVLQQFYVCFAEMQYQAVLVCYHL